MYIFIHSKTEIDDIAHLRFLFYLSKYYECSRVEKNKSMPNIPLNLSKMCHNIFVELV